MFPSSDTASSSSGSGSGSGLEPGDRSRVDCRPQALVMLSATRNSRPNRAPNPARSIHGRGRLLGRVCANGASTGATALEYPGDEDEYIGLSSMCICILKYTYLVTPINGIHGSASMNVTTARSEEMSLQSIQINSAQDQSIVNQRHRPPSGLHRVSSSNPCLS